MERFSSDRHRSVTPEMVVEILGRHGQQVTLQRAAAILEMIYEISWQSVALEIRLATEEQQLKTSKKSKRKTKTTTDENRRSICKGKHGRTGR